MRLLDDCKVQDLYRKKLKMESEDIVLLPENDPMRSRQLNKRYKQWSLFSTDISIDQEIAGCLVIQQWKPINKMRSKYTQTDAVVVEKKEACQQTSPEQVKEEEKVSESESDDTSELDSKKSELPKDEDKTMFDMDPIKEETKEESE